MLALAACEEPATSVLCGEGTLLEGTRCIVAPQPACAPGTHQVGGECVGDVSLTLRSAPMIRADGWTTSELVVVATNADGTPARERVVIAAQPATAGVIVSPDLTLDDRGAVTSFVPCTSADAACTGDVHFSAALASDPQTPIAAADSTLMAPPAIGSVAQCAGTGNVAFFDAQNFYFTGTRTFTDATAAFNADGAANRARLTIVVPNAESYAFNVDTIHLDMPLIRSVYEHTKGIGYAAAGEPVFQLVAFNGGCEADASVQVHDFVYDASLDRVVSLTLSFTERCTFDTTRTLTGCVHFSQ